MLYEKIRRQEMLDIEGAGESDYDSEDDDFD